MTGHSNSLLLKINNEGVKSSFNYIIVSSLLMALSSSILQSLYSSSLF